MASATDVARNILGQGLLLGWGDELEGEKLGDRVPVGAGDGGR